MPLVAPVRQTAPQPVVADLAAETRRQWLGSDLRTRLRPGARVAVGVGSRGIANLQTLVRATLDALRELGAVPFVVAAMGSHGGATAEGQRELLAEYGVSETALGVPVRTDMATDIIGTNSWGDPVYWDRNALAADAVVTISRVKPHTDFRSTYESGILKMLVIGLGKRDGASQHHRYGLRGLRDMLPDSGKVILAKTPFLGGLAVLENAEEQTGRLLYVGRDELLAVEPKLLIEARAMMGRLPFDQLDMLVIGEVGKNYSGAGIDPNVVGRLFVECEAEFEKPKITRICALDLSPESHGNGTGSGLADLTTNRFLSAIDPVPTRMNTLTACMLHRAKQPFGFENDRACLLAGVETCWQPSLDKVRLVLIPNTLEVANLWVSSALLAEVAAHPHLEQTGPMRPLPFDAAGNLPQAMLFPHSVCGRRGQVQVA